jgi:hypothetical protein
MSASPINNGAAAAAAPTSVNEARDPSGFLSEIIGAPVTVKLNSGVVYRGVFFAHLPLRLLAQQRRKRQEPKDEQRTIADKGEYR